MEHGGRKSSIFVVSLRESPNQKNHGKDVLITSYLGLEKVLEIICMKKCLMF